jgi:hypothetical protein
MQTNREESEKTLQSCLDLILSGQETLDSVLERYPEQAEMLRPQLESMLWLRNINQELDPRPGFVAASRRRLVSKIQQESVIDKVEDQAPKSGFFSLFLSRRFATPLIVALVLLISMYVAGNGLNLASQNAIPGDRLYSMKIVFEKAALAFSRDHANDAELRVEFTHRRSEEIYRLVAEGRYEYIPETVKSFENEVGQTIVSLNQVASQNDDQARQMAVELEDYLNHQRAVLAGLIQNAPVNAGPAISAAIQASVKGSRDARGVGNGSPASPTSTLIPPPRLTEPPAPTPTPKPTSTRPPVWTPTSPPTETPEPTNTRVPTHTPRPTNTPTPEPTDTPRPAPTDTPAPTSTATETPTSTPTETPTPTNTDIPTPTRTATPPPTNTAVPTSTHTPTSVPSNTETPTNTSTAIPGAINTPGPVDTPVSTGLDP